MPNDAKDKESPLPEGMKRLLAYLLAVSGASLLGWLTGPTGPAALPPQVFPVLWVVAGLLLYAAIEHVLGLRKRVASLQRAVDLRSERKERLARWRRQIDEKWASGSFWDCALWFEMKGSLPEDFCNDIARGNRPRVIIVNRGEFTRKMEIMAAIGHLEKEWGLVG